MPLLARRAPLRISMSRTPHDAAAPHTGTIVSAGPAPNPHWRLGFWSLMLTQFQGAFNDNGLKFLVFYLIIERNLPTAERDRFILLVGALFAVPFILFSL